MGQRRHDGHSDRAQGLDGCSQGRRSNQLMCKSHWYKVPKELRDRVWKTAREMHAAERKHGLTSDEWSRAYQAWREERDQAVAAVEMAEADGSE